MKIFFFCGSFEYFFGGRHEGSDLTYLGSFVHKLIWFRRNIIFKSLEFNEILTKGSNPLKNFEHGSDLILYWNCLREKNYIFTKVSMGSVMNYVTFRLWRGGLKFLTKPRKCLELGEFFSDFLFWKIPTSI